MPAEKSKETKKPSSQQQSPFGGPPHPSRFGAMKERPRDIRFVVSRLWNYLKRERYLVLLCVIVVILDSFADMTGPYLMRRAIDKCIIPHNIPLLRTTVLQMLSVGLFGCLCFWTHSYVMAGVAQRVVRDLRGDLFGKLQKLSLPFFDKNAHGDLMSRFTNDLDNISVILSNNVTQIVFDIFSGIGIVCVMFYLNPILGAVCVSSVLLVSLCINFVLAKRLRELFRARQATLGQLNGLIEETVTAQTTVKAIHREPSAVADFENSNRSFRDAVINTESFAGSVGPLMNFTNNIGFTLVVAVGGVLAVRHLATIGLITAFTSYVRMFSRPVNDIANLYNSLQSALAGAERVFNVIEETPEIDAPADAPDAVIKGDVVFENVTFSYVEGQPVLKNFSLHAHPGDTVALVGPTGAGKTTIINLLTRFYEIDSGRILIDGRDITTMRKEDLRRRLGIVLQGAFLFAGTVRENIRYGRLDASDDEVTAAARMANACR
jgi:ATP-binding cassette subfamily B protein